MSIQKQLGLKRGRLATVEWEHTEHTLKMMRILLSSDFQAVIFSESLLALTSREAALRPHRSSISIFILATVL